ncbi:MAG: M1 family metallopeptidase [Bifidobacteriaceae bacterium]|jgi:hypothetical protein|nr:M1 family metallopeptidase [Bifidobacteriaceae bacterium]
MTAPTRLRFITGALTAILLAGAPITAGAPAYGDDPPIPGALVGGDSLIIHQGNGGYDVQHYDIDLTYWLATGEQTQGTITATTTIDARALHPLSSFGLDFKGLTVDAVTINGTPAAEWSRIVNPDDDEFKLVVTPADPIPVGDFTVVVSYSGTPEGYTYRGSGSYIEGWLTSKDFTAGGATHTGDGGATGIGQPVGSITWFPNNDVPTDKATYTTTLTVPKEFKGVGIGQLTGVVPVSATHSRWSWDEPVPTATFLTIAAIGEFNQYTGSHTTPGGQTVPISVFADPYLDAAQNNGGTQHLIDLTKDLLDWGEERFGVYQPSVAGYVQKSIGANYALEIFGKPFYNGNISESTYIHEFSHQWAGDSVGVKDWTDLWLAEGFATFAPWLWTEDHGGQSTSARTRNTWAATAATNALWRVAPARLITKSNLWGTASYNGGGLAFGALRAGIGDEAFFALIKEWFARYAGANASTEDFVALAEEISGVDLTAFATEWLYEAGKPATWPGDHPYDPAAVGFAESEIAPGNPLVVTGTGFKPGTVASIFVDDAVSPVARVAVGASGTVTTTINQPLAGGAHEVRIDADTLSAVGTALVVEIPYATLDVLSAAIGAYAGFEAIADTYAPASYAPLGQALSDARALVNRGSATSLEINEAVSALGSAARGLVTAVDTAPLATLVADALAVLADRDAYQGPGIEALEAALDAASQALSNPDITDADVRARALDLADALHELTERGDIRPLRALIALAGALEATSFIPRTWDAVVATRDAARLVVESADPSRSAVDEAYEALRDAIGGLTPRANKTGLISAVALADVVLAALDRYEDSTVEGLADARARAQAVVADANATAAQVATARDALVAAVAAARLKRPPASPVGLTEASSAVQRVVEDPGASGEWATGGDAQAPTAHVSTAQGGIAKTKPVKAASAVKIAVATKVRSTTRGVVTVRVTAKGVKAPTGKVVVSVGKKSVSTTLKAKARGVVKVKLPVLSAGTYKVSAVYRGSATTARAVSATRTIKVP